MASSDELSGTLDVDVVGLVDLDFKSEPDFFDFDSGGEFGLFGEAGVALHTTATTTHSSQSSAVTSQNVHSAHTAAINAGISGGALPNSSSGPSHSRSSQSRKSKSHWNEVEKELFTKGMELFGPNWSRISNFIATKTPGQVRCFHKKWAETSNIIIDDSYVYMPCDPVCITTVLEDPLGLIETATTTVTTTPFSPKRDRHNSDRNKEVTNEVFYGDLTSSDDVYVPSVGEEWVIVNNETVSDHPSHDHKPKKRKSSKKKQENRKKVKKKNRSPSKQPFKTKTTKSPKKKKKLKRTPSPKKVVHSTLRHGKKQATSMKKTSIVENFAPPVLEGQVVHIVKDDEEESDVDIDISDDEQLMIVDNPTTEAKSPQKLTESSEEHTSVSKDSSDVDNTFVNNSEDNSQDLGKPQTFVFPPPTKEITLDPNIITEEEKKVHYEYFDGKGVKTPERYLRIRNYLLNCWKQSRPKYVRKTTVRAGLKHCGDVNSIGKVHEYLEKIGAINFDCSESNYSSPLTVGIKPRERISLPYKSGVKVDRSDMSRQKQKKKLDYRLSEGGGLTISHDESGAVIDACHIPEAPRSKAGAAGGRLGKRTEQFKLIRCLDHDPDTPAPFSVVMHAHALITLDLHSHTSLAEVMGLLGGYYDPAAHVLYVTVAVPTKAVSSGVECDMCPISQSAACTAIHEGGVQVVGWYHSHPTFPPNPSVQDIDTQSQMQKWFARQDAPFLGIIVSPFCPTNQTEASHIRCIVLDKAPHASFESEEEKQCHTPYKLSWSVSEVIPGGWEEVCHGIREVVGSARDDAMAIDWRDEWRGHTTNWEKTIASLHHHLPSQLHGPLQVVRAKFLAAVREYMGS